VEAQTRSPLSGGRPVANKESKDEIPIKFLTITATAAVDGRDPRVGATWGRVRQPRTRIATPTATPPRGATRSRRPLRGPKASLPAKAHAYGVFCNKSSKKQRCRPERHSFSQCVTAMAKLANGSTKDPAKACATSSKKHVAGQKGDALQPVCLGGGQAQSRDQKLAAARTA